MNDAPAAQSPNPPAHPLADGPERPNRPGDDA